MNLARPARVLVALAVAAGGLAFPVMEAAAKKPPPVVYAPPPPPPEAPPVGLSDRLLADAAVYEAYMQSASAIQPGFTDGGQVAAALKAGSSYEPKALLRGAVAYGAIAALQDRTFVATVRSYSTTPEARARLMREMLGNSGYALSLKGGAGAAGYAKQAIGGGAMSVFYAGRKVKQAAYDIQRQPWSLNPVEARDARLVGVRGLSTGAYSPPVGRSESLRSTVAGGGALIPPVGPAGPPYTPLVANAVTLAAFAAMGEATDRNIQATTYLGSEVNTALCLNMAKLNLYQCLAVAKPHYEDVFCLGQHAMIDTGVCLARFSGATLPLEVNPKPLNLPPPKTTPAAKPKPKPRKK